MRSKVFAASNASLTERDESVVVRTDDGWDAEARGAVQLGIKDGNTTHAWRVRDRRKGSKQDEHVGMKGFLNCVF